jgi:hypothetical protein
VRRSRISGGDIGDLDGEFGGDCRALYRPRDHFLFHFFRFFQNVDKIGIDGEIEAEKTRCVKGKVVPIVRFKVKCAGMEGAFRLVRDPAFPFRGTLAEVGNFERVLGDDLVQPARLVQSHDTRRVEIILAAKGDDRRAMRGQWAGMGNEIGISGISYLVLYPRK